MAAPRVERRLAAILAADVVGYARLMRSDEEGTLARLKLLRRELVEPLLAEHGGRLVKLIGDGALCEFPSVVDALACGVVIQRGVAAREQELAADRRLRLRIGIHLGDVIHEADGDLYGDGVNIAARLEGLAEPGGICVSQPVFLQAGARPELSFAAMGAHAVKSIAEPLPVWRVVLDGGAASGRPARARRGVRSALIAAAVAATVVAPATAWWLWRQPPVAALPLPDNPSIAVLPFDNLSGDERLGRLADGLVADVITDLSRFRELFVIGRSSSFSYRGKAVDPREVGRDLGVRYVLTGSTQSAGDRLRLTAQLVEAATGAQVWSERYDRPLDDLFAVQADLTERIVGALGGSRGAIQEARLEAARYRAPQSLEAFDLYLLGTELRVRLTPKDHAEGMELLRRSVAADPLFATAWIGLALGYWNQVDYGWAPFDQAMAQWLAAASRAVELDPGNALGHVALGMRYGYGNDFGRNLAEFEAALGANPNDVTALAFIAGNLPWLEPPGRALELIERATRLNPNDRLRGHQAKLVYYYAGRYEQAIAAAMSHGELSFFDYLYLAMSNAQLGRADEAGRDTAEVLRLKPSFSAEWALTYLGEFAPGAAVNRTLFLDGVAKAGLPRCATGAQVAADAGIRRWPECDAERAGTLAGKL
ncbi:MAG: adenylate/guanylate cyclase domain-containing protein [Geminicoccaceae bacterium]